MEFERRPTFTQSLIAGGAAGIAADLLCFPIDTVKTRLQSAQGFVKAGGFKDVYKGFGSVLVGSAPASAMLFATYEWSKRTLPLHGQLAPLNHMISASIGETVLAACLIRVPTEVIKTRTQTSSYGVTATSLTVAKMVLKQDGLMGFYRGFGTTIMRDIPFTSLHFSLYEFFKLQLSLALGTRPLHAWEAGICGSIAGSIAAALTTPLDVVKTQEMLDIRSNGKGPTLEMPSALSRFRQIYIVEGPGALFAGVIPRTLWISTGGAVFLGVYEWVVGILVGR